MNTLVRYNRFPSLFDRAFSREFSPFLGWPNTPLREVTSSPAVNVKEDEKAFYVEVVAPGLKKENFSINVHQNRLTVSARQEEDNEEKVESYCWKEFSFKAFERSFHLPKNVDSDQIQATYTDGILTIGIPKVTQSTIEPKQIAVA